MNTRLRAYIYRCLNISKEDSIARQNSGGSIDDIHGISLSSNLDIRGLMFVSSSSVKSNGHFDREIMAASPPKAASLLLTPKVLVFVVTIDFVKEELASIHNA